MRCTELRIFTRLVYAVLAWIPGIVSADAPTAMEWRSAAGVRSDSLLTLPGFRALPLADPLPGGEAYVAGLLLGAIPPGQEFRLQCGNCRILSVQAEGSRMGADLRGRYMLRRPEGGRILLVKVLPEGGKASLALVPGRGTAPRPGLAARIPLQPRPPALSAHWVAEAGLNGSENAVANGTSNGESWFLSGKSDAGRLRIAGRDYGDVDAGRWTRAAAPADTGSLKVTLSGFFGDAELLLPPHGKAALALVPRAESGAQAASGRLGKRGASPSERWEPGMRNRIGKIAAPMGIGLSLGEAVYDPGSGRPLVAAIQAPVGRAWAIGPQGRLLQGEGPNPRAEIPAAGLASESGLKALELRSGGLFASARVFVANPGALKVDYSRITLDPSGQDTAGILPNLPGARFSLTVYDGDWRSVFSDSGKDAFAWNGRTRTGRIALPGAYRAVVEARDDSGRAFNHVQAMLIIPSGTLPKPTLRFQTRDTQYVDDSAVVVTYVANGKTLSDTVLPGQYGKVIRRAERFGSYAEDTIVILDTIPPKVALDSSKLNLLPPKDGVAVIATNTGHVVIDYSANGVAVKFDTVLAEGEHTVRLKAVDASGNATITEIIVRVDLSPPVVVAPDSLKGGAGKTTINYSVDGKPMVLDTVLSEGVHVIVIEGKDEAGNTTRKEITVRVHIPVVVIVSPAPGDTIKTRTGRFTIDLKVDGVAMSVDTILPAGKRELIVSGKDPEGFPYLGPVLTIWIDSPFPSVKILEPVRIATKFPIRFSLAWFDTVSAVAPKSLKAFLDTQDIASGFKVSGDTARWDLTDAARIHNGKHWFKATIRNEALNEAVDSVAFDFVHVEAMPSVYPDSGAAPLKVVFQTRAIDPGGTVEWYRWDFDGDGTIDNDPFVQQVTKSYTYTYAQPGIYHPTLEALSNTGEKSLATLRVVVTNPKPQAFAEASPSNGGAPLAVALVGRSRDSIGYVKYHEWDFEGDGKYDTLLRVSLDTLVPAAYGFKNDLEGWKAGGTSGAFGRVAWAKPADSLRAILPGQKPGSAWIEADPDTLGYGNTRDCWLESPAQAQSKGEPMWLLFRYLAETNDVGDGSWLEASVDGGAYSKITPSGGYPGTITDRGPGYAGARRTGTAAFRLDSLGGDSLRIRLRFVSNATGTSTYRGMMLDSLRFIRILPPDVPDTALAYSETFDTSDGGWSTTGTAGVWGRVTPSSPSDSVWATNPIGVPASITYSPSTLVTDSVVLPAAAACTLQVRSDFRFYSGAASILIQPDSGASATLYQMTATKRDTILRLGLDAYAGRTVRFSFAYPGYTGSAANYGWDLDAFSVYSGPRGSGEVLWSDSVENSKRKWSVTGTAAYKWFKRPRLLAGDSTGWMAVAGGAGAYSASSSGSLVSPWIDLDPGSQEMTFRQYLSTESNKDGGNLSIQLETAKAVPLTPTPSYNGSVKMAGSTAAVAAWTGSLGWSTPHFNLTPYAGRRVRFIFAFASDSVNNTGAWLIDGFRIYDPRKPTRVLHTYAKQGTYPAAFRATNNFGESAIAARELTRIQAGPAGSPSAYAEASVTEGNAPLKVAFKGWGRDPDGSIAKYEWDFEGDGKYDTTLKDSGSITHTYTEGGTFRPVMRVVDNDLQGAKTGEDQMVIRVWVRPTLAITETDRTFAPESNEAAGVKTVLNGPSKVRLAIKDQTGTVVRELVPWTDRAPGTYTDAWNGRDDAGQTLPQGVYYAVLGYRYGGEEYELDLTDTTGQVQAYLTRTPNKTQFSPYDDDPLGFSFTLPSACEVTFFMGFLGVNQRVRTLAEREMFPAGTHTLTWDGLDDKGVETVTPAGDNIIAGGWTFTLPDNAVYISSARPEISLVNADPNYISPFSQVCSLSGTGITFGYSLSEACAKVQTVVMEAKTGIVVANLDFKDRPAGKNTLFWNGKLPDGTHVDVGTYRFGLKGINAKGRESMFRYTLIQVAP